MLRAIGRSDPSVDPPTGHPSADGFDICAVGARIWPIGGYCFEKEGKLVMLLKDWMVMTKNVSDKPKMNHNNIWTKA